MNRRYNYSRLSPSVVEHYSCPYSQGSSLGPGLSPGVPSDLYRPQFQVLTELVHMPLYELEKPENNDDKEEASVTADKLKSSGSCCGR